LQRALEVCYQTAAPYSQFRKRKPQPRPFDVIWVALKVDRLELINRINSRVEKMMASGLLAEARSLYHMRHYNALNTVGYKELFNYFDHKLDLEQAVEQIKLNTRQYAKRQMTWFRKNNNYKWFNPEDLGAMIEYVENTMSEPL
jgi:tRNA dimethylallyltransferase